MPALADSLVYHVFGAPELRDSCYPAEGGIHQWRGDHLALSTRGPEWAAAVIPQPGPNWSPARAISCFRSSSTAKPNSPD